VAFEDSQYQGDATETDSSSEEGGGAKGKGKGKGKARRVSKAGKEKEDEEEAFELDRDSVESSSSSEESLTGRKRLRTPGRARRFSLGRHAVPAAGGSRPVRTGRRIFWSEDEVAQLRKAVLEDGLKGQWAVIRDTYNLHPCRSAVDIKDKWRNIEKTEAPNAR
jgi:hypothetical protein